MFLKWLFPFLALLFCCSCGAPVQRPAPAKNERGRVVQNLRFFFPPAGYAYEQQEALIAECRAAVQANRSLLRLPAFTDSVTVHFVASRAEMKRLTGSTASGLALPEFRTLYVVASGDSAQVKPPIHHEMMHMMSMLAWGPPHPQSQWMNEGLATLAAENCNGYTPVQIFRYLLDSNMLLPVELLITNFYQQPEMIAYHQAAFVVQWLLQHRGVEQFKLLWQQGFDFFERIYGLPFRELYQQVRQASVAQTGDTPRIDWTRFEKGCL